MWKKCYLYNLIEIFAFVFIIYRIIVFHSAYSRSGS